MCKKIAEMRNWYRKSLLGIDLIYIKHFGPCYVCMHVYKSSIIVKYLYVLTETHIAVIINNKKPI